MRKELLKGLTEEQIKKVEACNSSDEILALAKEEGVTLTDEQLEAVSGGCGGGKKDWEPTDGPDIECKICQSHKVLEYRVYDGYHKFHCQKCNEVWYDFVDYD